MCRFDVTGRHKTTVVFAEKVAIEFCLDLATIHCEEDVGMDSWSAIS